MSLRIIGGKFRGRLLKTPKQKTTRPTQSMVREAVFNMCQNEIENALFLDVCAGSGAMGFEALSRGARGVVFIENGQGACRCIEENTELLGVGSEVRLMHIPYERAVSLLQKKGEFFDIIYADPPYNMKFSHDTLALLLKPGGTLFIEQRYDANKEPHFDTHLFDQRRFGTSMLYRLRF